MGRRKQFIDKKNASTYRVIYRPGSDGAEPQQMLLPVSGKAQPGLVEEFEGREEDDAGFNMPFFCGQLGDLSEEKRREIVELGFPDDGYDYLKHLRVIKKSKEGIWSTQQKPEPTTSTVLQRNEGSSSKEGAMEFLPPQPDVKFIDARGVGVSPTSEDPDNFQVSKSIYSSAHMLEDVGRNQAREIRELEALMEEMEKSDDEPQNFEFSLNQNYNHEIQVKGDLLDDFVISAAANEISDQNTTSDPQISDVDLNFEVNLGQNQVASKNLDNSDLISSRSTYSMKTSINIGSEALSGSQYMQEVQFEKFQKLMDEYERDGDFEGLEDIIEGEEFEEYESNDNEVDQNVQQLELAMNELIISKKGELKQVFDIQENDTQHTTLQNVNQDEEIKQKIRSFLGLNSNKTDQKNANSEDCEIQNFDDDADNINFVNDDIYRKNVKSVWVETNLPSNLRWDCQSIASIQSSTRNQAGLLSAPKKLQKVKQSPNMQQYQTQNEDVKSEVSNVSTIRMPNETPEEKRARKSAIKVLRRETRAAKKQMKQMFSQERVSQQRHSSSMGVQVKVVL